MAEIVRIDESTWRIENEFVRFFLLTGSEKALLIDSGFNCENAKSMVEELTNLPIILLNTHGDGDHVSGTGAFSEVYMSENDYYGCGLDERFPETKLIKVAEGDIIDLGNRHIKIYDIPGHTRGSIAILDVEKRRIFTGDSVQKGHIYMFGDKRVPNEYGKSLEKIISLKAEFDSIIASHDEPILPSDYADKVLKTWNEVKAGKIGFTEMDLYGQKIKSYDGNYCGFYCE